MLEGRHYQNAYITRDIDKAVASFQARGAAQDARVFEASVELQTPAGRGTAVSKLCFIWINDLQFELIQPVSGLVDIYSDALPADNSLKFHHICMRVENWEDFRARVGRQNLPVAIEGGSEQLRFLYLDARKFLGHYLEYVWMTDERWKQLGGR
jgi:hypothetical protein